jgi:hypothetical protein
MVTIMALCPACRDVVVSMAFLLVTLPSCWIAFSEDDKTPLYRPSNPVA